MIRSYGHKELQFKMKKTFFKTILRRVKPSDEHWIKDKKVKCL